MPVSKPTQDQLQAIAQDMGLSLTNDDIKSFAGLMAPYVDGYNAVATNGHIDFARCHQGRTARG